MTVPVVLRHPLPCSGDRVAIDDKVFVVSVKSGLRLRVALPPLPVPPVLVDCDDSCVLREIIAYQSVVRAASCLTSRLSLSVSVPLRISLRVSLFPLSRSVSLHRGYALTISSLAAGR